MEGDVLAILPRPTLPASSPNPNDPPSYNPNAVHRYASRDLRTKEAQAEIEKWDAWNGCAGMTRTEAKRRYISTLIETMKEYASGTSESRELVSELEFVWNQIRSQSGSDESEEGESPTRKLERAGLKQTMPTDRVPSPSRPGRTTSERTTAGGFGSILSRINSSVASSHHRPSRTQSHQAAGLRVLSPISQRSPDDIMENEELPQPGRGHRSDDEQEDDDEHDMERYRTTPSSPTRETSTRRPPPAIPSSGPSDPWRASIEAALRHLTLELTALREQLSTHNLLSRSSFSQPLNYNTLSLGRRILVRISIWVRWAVWTTVRQLIVQLGLLMMIMLYGRVKGDRRVEEWVTGRLKRADHWMRADGEFRFWRLLR